MTRFSICAVLCLASHLAPALTLPNNGGLISRESEEAYGIVNSTITLFSRDDDIDDEEIDMWLDPTSQSSYYHCDYTQRFDSLQALADYHGNMNGEHIVVQPNQVMSSTCRSFHALKLLITMLDRASNDYPGVDQGFDDLFKLYQQYIKDVTPDVILHKLMFTIKDTPTGQTFEDGPGIKFFDCTINGKTTACADRKQSASDMSVPFSLKLRDQNGFNDELAKQGLAPDWITFGDSSISSTNTPAGKSKITLAEHFQNFPIRNDSMVVPNPKNIVTTAFKTSPDLRFDMQSTMLELALGQWISTSMADPAQVYSLPVFSFAQGVQNMKDAKNAAQQVKDAEQKEAGDKKKNLLLLILNAILLFVPVVGEVVDAVTGLASLAHGIAILGDLGTSALAIYDTVNNPQNALLNVIGTVLGSSGLAKATRSEKGLGDVAVIRAGIKADTIAKFGSIFKENDAALQKMLSQCRK